jgi:hypothetical protein
VSVRDLVRPMPGVRKFSLLRQRVLFNGSANFWERNYVQGLTSGCGSYGSMGKAKAAFLNSFVRDHHVSSVVEFGCGDGYQLSLADYPCYVGLDVSRTAIGLCQRRFPGDSSKSFFLYDGTCFRDSVGLFAAELALSLDVIYHLIEDPVFETYMTHLFAAGRRYVIVYSTNMAIEGTAPHVRHRCFTPWVEQKFPEWKLAHVSRGPFAPTGQADFFVYERLGENRS